MNVLVVLGHPQKGSFNHAIAETVVETLTNRGHAVLFHDLYAEGFDPLMPHEEILKNSRIDTALQQHCEELSSADGIVIIHPNWWGQPPAILKGWVDRVFRPGVAYEFLESDSGEGVPRGMLNAKAALVFNTSNTHQERELNVFGDPLERTWKDCIFALCGVRNFSRKTFSVVVTSTPEQRKAWLREVRDMVGRLFP